MGKASRTKGFKALKPSSSATPPSLDHKLRLPTPGLFILLPLVVVPTLIYSNTFQVPFFFDDMGNIIENPMIRKLSNFFDSSSPRYIGFLSLALNYHFHGLSVAGYHLVNLIIHILNGLLVYYLTLTLLELLDRSYPPTQDHLKPILPNVYLALTTAMLFACHPIQTQAVTYIVQRLASLTSLFYLVAVIAYLKYRQCPTMNPSRIYWYATALFSTILAMKTKEISFTLPFTLILIEWVFFQTRQRGRWAGLVPFLFTLPIIPLSHPELWNSFGTPVGEAIGSMNRSSYFLTQLPVIMTYLRLLVLPLDQNIDYDYPVYHSLWEPRVYLSLFSILILLAIAFLFLVHPRLRSRTATLASFGILWFFVTVSVESSIIPIADVIFEHRVYLPSFGFLLTLASTSFGALEFARARSVQNPHTALRFLQPKAYGVIMALFILILSLMTYQRNMAWKDNLTLWADSVRKSPDKLRPRYNLAVAYQNLGRYDEAIVEYERVLNLEPDYPGLYFQAKANFHLGTIYQSRNQNKKAIEHFRNASELQPDFVEAFNSLGIALAAEGHLEEALKAYQTVNRMDPDLEKGYNNLGNILADLGRYDEAIDAYRTALRLNPRYFKAYNNLGVVLQDQGHLPEAIEAFRSATRISPQYENAHYNIGMAYATLGDYGEAEREFETVLRLNPDNVASRYQLGLTQIKLGKPNKARDILEAFLEENPNHPEARYHLGVVLEILKNHEEARIHYREALRLNPDFEEAKAALDALMK